MASKPRVMDRGQRRRESRAWAVALSLVSLLTFAAAAGAAPVGYESPSKIDDVAEDCLEAVPEQVSVTGVTDTGQEVVLEVHVLLDRVSEARGADVMTRMAKAYAPLNISIRPTFQTIEIEHQRIEGTGLNGTGPEKLTSDAGFLMERAKEAVGDVRPPASDVVYLLTSAEIAGSTAGMADCIGGVRYPSRAFAIGEEEPDADPSSTLNFCCTWTTAKIAGHEVAHLLGAHHHYANCAEGAPAAVEDRHLFTCTLMFNDVGGINLRFSTLEAATVRGHALEYAHERVDPPPPSDSPPFLNREVTLNLRKHLVARGRLVAEGDEDCVRWMDLQVERRNGKRWRVVQEFTGEDDGSYRVRLPDKPGRYRVHTAETEVGGGAVTCGSATSPVAKHKH